MLTSLRRSRILRSIRGPRGGYQLARTAGDIYVAQIIDAVDESVDATRCGGQGDCQQGATCLTHELWTDLSQQIHHFLANISLQELVSRREVQAVSIRQSEVQKRRERAVDPLAPLF